MNFRFFNSFTFLRRCFNLPRNKKLRWGIVKEVSTSKGEDLRLCVLIENTDKYIDIAQRRIFSKVDSGLVKRIALPANRYCGKTEYVYFTNNGWYIHLPKTFIMDIYSKSWWQDGKTEKELLM